MRLLLQLPHQVVLDIIYPLHVVFIAVFLSLLQCLLPRLNLIVSLVHGCQAGDDKSDGLLKCAHNEALYVLKQSC